MYLKGIFLTLIFLFPDFPLMKNLVDLHLLKFSNYQICEKTANNWNILKNLVLCYFNRINAWQVSHCIINDMFFSYNTRNTFFLHVWYRQDFLACIRTTYLESRITLKIAKTHISPRAKHPYHPYHTLRDSCQP